ncbi:hypothetical protein [Oceanobacillus sp. FSL H7-0719]|uniref:hypothetical protein n=1 Tax=Oceanobacillus sp. FSL H7-0719 TaxID=2954507 RepID=UPI003244938E
MVKIHSSQLEHLEEIMEEAELYEWMVRDWSNLTFEEYRVLAEKIEDVISMKEYNKELILRMRNEILK